MLFILSLLLYKTFEIPSIIFFSSCGLYIAVVVSTSLICFRIHIKFHNILAYRKITFLKYLCFITYNIIYIYHISIKKVIKYFDF